MAIARPIPVVPPVIAAVLPFRKRQREGAIVSQNRSNELLRPSNGTRP